MSITAYLQRQSQSIQRVMAVLLLTLVICVIGGVVGVLLPQFYASQGQWRMTAHRELGQLRGLLANANNVNAKQGQLKADVIWKEFYTASDSSEATATIQRDVTSVLNVAGAVNVSSQPLESATLPNLGVHGVRAAASLDIEQLRVVMLALRAHVPYLRLQGIQVTAPQVEARNENPTLLAVLDVVGYTQRKTTTERISP